MHWVQGCYSLQNQRLSDCLPSDPNFLCALADFLNIFCILKCLHSNDLRVIFLILIYFFFFESYWETLYGEIYYHHNPSFTLKKKCLASRQTRGEKVRADWGLLCGDRRRPCLVGGEFLCLVSGLAFWPVFDLFLWMQNKSPHYGFLSLLCVCEGTNKISPFSMLLWLTYSKQTNNHTVFPRIEASMCTAWLQYLLDPSSGPVWNQLWLCAFASKFASKTVQQCRGESVTR